jgi:hypothetical protein
LGKGGRNIGIGQYCNYENADRVDIGWTAHFNTGIGLRKVFANGVWENGKSLSSAVSAADTSVIMSYTVFLAILRNGGSDYPVLFARSGNIIAGGFSGSTITMTYADNTLTLSGAGSTTVTALYELL